MKFHAEPFEHEQAEKIGVLLVNLGSPDAPDAPSIRRFLRAFLSDHRVIEIPQVVWQIILNFFILPFRPGKLVPLYQSIWTDQGSPLVAIAGQQKQQLEQLFQDSYNQDPDKEILCFALAMRYGKPDIASALQQLAQQNARKILVFPTYPQYSGTTTASIFDAVTKELQQWRWVPELRFINQYHDNTAYIQALANFVREHWNQQGQAEKLIMSFHGLPKFCLDKGDPYFCQCHKTARLLAEKLGLTEQQWHITFQSRFGKAEWLKPYTSSTLEELAQQGTRSVDVICPGFAIDCLETLEEIAVENRDIFKNAGGKEYHYIPALNASQPHIDVLAGVIKQYIQGWGVETNPQVLKAREGRASVQRSAFSVQKEPEQDQKSI